MLQFNDSIIPKRLKIRLGGRCNQSCSFCHSNDSDDYEFNPEVLPFIKYNNFSRIRYSGGEPLLYWDEIMRIVDYLPDTVDHSIVTNGSLFNERIFNDCINHDISISISINQFTNLSDEACYYLSKLPHLGTATLYSGDLSFDEIDNQRKYIEDKIGRHITNFYNMMHTIRYTDKSYSSKEMSEYLNGMEYRLDKALEDLPRVSDHTIFLYTFMTLFKPSSYGCSNPEQLTISLDGRIMDCSYNLSYNGLTINDYNKLHPTLHKSKCYSCNLFGRCKSCYISVNDDECYLYNKLYDMLIIKLDKLNLSYDNLLSYLRYALTTYR